MGVAAVIVSDATDVDLVQRALASVLYQTHPVDEIVIVEAKRRITNDLEEMVHRMGGNVLLEHYDCYNASMARNHGAMLCSSEYICFLDGDDEWSPHMIEDRMALMDDDVCIITSPYARMKDKNGTLDLFTPTVPSGTELFGRNVIGSNSYVMVRREPFMEVGGFDPHLVYHQDWDLWIRMLEHGKVAISPRLGGIKYYNNFSASHNSAVCRDGWSCFVRKWGHIYRHERVHLDSVIVLYSQHMSCFNKTGRPVKGPLGFMCRIILGRLPSWFDNLVHGERPNRNRITSIGEAGHRIPSLKDEVKPQLICMMYQMFKGGRIRPGSCHS